MPLFVLIHRPSVAAGLADRGPDQPLVLAGHSDAGVFMPVIADGLGRPVTCSIFADTTVPAASDRTPMAPEEFLPFLPDQVARARLELAESLP